jgi:CheY-like chemotaxis protein
MTARAMIGDKEECLAAGMDGYISKPIDARSLFDLIDNLVRRKPLELDLAEAGASAIREEVKDNAFVGASDGKMNNWSNT